MPYFALASGFLTGKYRSEVDLRGASREQMANAYMSAEGLAVVEVLDRIATAREVAIPTVALAWLRSRPGVAAPIASARTVEQLPPRSSRPRRSSSPSWSGRTSMRRLRASTADAFPGSVHRPRIRARPLDLSRSGRTDRSGRTEPKGITMTTKTVLIIGGTSGMGRAVADLVAARGDVAIVAGRSQERVDRVASEIRGTARGVVIDLTDESSIRNAVASIGAGDHLVLAAALRSPTPVRGAEHRRCEGGVREQVLGVLACVSIITPALSKDGSITVFSGVAADRPAPGTVAVTAVNAALEGLTRSLAVELSHRSG